MNCKTPEINRSGPKGGENETLSDIQVELFESDWRTLLMWATFFIAVIGFFRN